MISVDLGEPKETVQTYAEEQGLTFPILLDQSAAVGQVYRARGVPTSFFIDRNGVIQHQQTGPLNEAAITAHLEPML